MNKNLQGFEQKFAALREKYARQLSDYIDFLEPFTVRKELTANDRTAIAVLAHKLSGSGKTFGFAKISTAAAELETRAFTPGAADQDIQQAISELITTLKNAEQEKASAADPTHPDAPGLVAAAPSDKPVFLLIEDDPAIQSMIKDIFADTADIHIADTVKDGFRILEKYKPTLLLLDDGLKAGSGLDMLETIQNDSALNDIPVIMITGRKAPKDILRGYAAGAIDYVTKPFNPEELFKKVTGLVLRHKLQILIADDDEPVRELLSYKFKNMGCRILTAENGKEAFETIQKEKPDLVILDRMMPGGDGMAVLRKILQTDGLQDIPVIFLTAKQLDGDIVEALAAGASDYIVKPFSADEVVMRSMRLLNIKRPK